MNEKIQPALTPEEWELVADALEERRASADQAADRGSESGTDALHRLEAVIDGIRRGQPFGFTWEDVDALRFAAEALGGWRAAPRADTEESRQAAHYVAMAIDGRVAAVRSLADRIAALLPPRE